MRGRRIMVIESDRDLLETLETIFTRAGGQVYPMVDVLDGLHRLDVCRPHLIILDIDNTTTDGWEIFRRIRALSDVPILILTGLDTEDKSIHDLDVGPVDYVAKPFRPTVLLARARTALSRAGLAAGPQGPGP